MHVITGRSALRLLRAIRTRSYRGREVWLPAVDPLPSADDLSETDTASAELPAEESPVTLADGDFDFDSVVAGKRVDLERFYDLGPFTVDDPLELGVFDLNKRINLKTTKSRVLSRALPEAALLRVNRNLYVASPELAVVQIAETATLMQLTQVIMELCGTYSPTPHPTADHPETAKYEIPPVTSLERISTFAVRVRAKVKARDLVKRAVAIAREGAASPAETNLALMLGLPVKQGGYGFGMPQFNARLDAPEDERPYVTQAYYQLDLYWEDCKADIEYESTAFHLDPLYGIPSSRLTSDKVQVWREGCIERGAHDRTRLRDIQTLGTRVIPVLATDLRDARSLERIARALARRKAETTGFDDAAYLAGLDTKASREAHEALFAELFSPAAEGETSYWGTL